MRAWRVHEWGEPESLRLEEVDEPAPNAGEVRIRNRAAALNFFDALQIQGKYQIKPPFPFIPGAEVAGVVDEVGPNVEGFRIGDRVMAMPRGNGFAEATVAKVTSVFPIPTRMSFEEGVSMLVPHHTSFFALQKRTQLARGEALLVHAAASGVGVSAIQIGKALGARVLATAGSQCKLDFARSQGADDAFDYSDPTWVERVRAVTNGRGVDVVYDPVGADIFDLSTKCLAPEGRLLVIGFAGGRIPTIATNRVLLKNICIVGVLWGAYIQEHPAYPAFVHARLAEWVEEGRFRPAVGACAPFDEAPRALRDLVNRRVMGKAVLSIAN